MDTHCLMVFTKENAFYSAAVCSQYLFSHSVCVPIFLILKWGGRKQKVKTNLLVFSVWLLPFGASHLICVYLWYFSWVIMKGQLTGVT